ncbi:MAG: chorismate-binding protein [Bacteroidales bacterium]
MSSYPMKGAIDAAISGAATVIMNDPKEEAEHNTIVDLIRNDLSIGSDDVKGYGYRYLEEITTAGRSLLQLSSEISGSLDKEWTSGWVTWLLPMLPAGSVSRAPKEEHSGLSGRSETGARGTTRGVRSIRR